jgi:TolB protein
MIKRIISFLLLANLSVNTYAVLDITITQGIEEALPIAIVPFQWQGQPNDLPVTMHLTIANNLARSGRFRTMDAGDMPQTPSQFNQINFADWRLLGMENIVIGNIRQTGTGQYDIEFRLINVYSGEQVSGFRIPASRDQLRRTAHRISDIVFEKLTGVRGAFDTRIAYITVKPTPDGDKVHTLQVADADGFNPQILLESNEPLMSPAWSPDGKMIAYVSFESRNSAIYIQDILTGARQMVASNPGINSAPSWSPDGTRLALTLSKEGDPEVFILNLATRNLIRITNNRAIDTEPTWSPDGSSLLFTSDRGGSPQIYQVSSSGGTARRMTFEGNYNSRARYSPDGSSITMVHNNGGGFRIATMDLANRFVNVLTTARLDESPSFSPNGSMIIYATTRGRGTELAAVSSDGRVHQRLGLQDGDVREPEWGPFPPQ